jgi:hypothetical protein
MASTKLNFKTPLTNFSNEPMLDELGKPIILDNILANLIMQSSVQDPDKISKFMEWGMDLSKSGELSLDGTDKKTLSGFVSEVHGLTLIVKGRLLEIINA